MATSQLHSMLFAIICLLALLMGDLLIKTDNQIIFGLIIIALGVPHGALDIIFARHRFALNSVLGWIIFGCGYIAIGLLVILLWWLSEASFLLGFLIISMIHFSGDLAKGSSLIARVTYGGAIIILPTLLHADKVKEIFSLLVANTHAHMIVTALSYLAGPWLFALFITCLFSVRKDWISSLELICVGLVAVIAPPLLAFTLFFCGMHSLRHIIRTKEYSGESIFFVLKSMILPMFILIIITPLAWYFLKNPSFHDRLMQLIFIGLSALTVPHMILIEKVRWQGWASWGRLNSM